MLQGLMKKAQAINATSCPLVSVGLPTFNRAKALGRAIESVLSQDYSNLELVISDNASNDETEKLCAEFAARDSRVKYRRQPVNRGAHANFVAVLSLSAGRYFMWLGDDDWLDKSYLSHCVEVLEARADVALVCGKASYFDGDEPAFEGVKMNLEDESPVERVLEFYRHVNDNGTFYGIARRELLQATPLPTDLGGDWLMMASLAHLGKILTLDDVAVHRSSRGASENVEILARNLGFSARRARQPHRTIAVNVARDIATTSRAYRSLNLLGRWRLAGACALLVNKRFVKVENPLTTFATRIGNRARRLFRAR